MTRPRRRGPGYWLRLPGPATATGAIVAVLMVACGLLGGEPLLAIAALGPAVAAFWVWRTRDVWRHNAEQWRYRRDGAI